MYFLGLIVSVLDAEKEWGGLGEHKFFRASDCQ
jgi:hypothetical protein